MVEENKIAGLSVLIVEDHHDSANAIARLLRTIGHRTQVAPDCRKALDLANAETFDLVISDISLPDGSGLELIGDLLRIRPIKGIALSGLTSGADEQNSRNAGFSEHLGKPIDFVKLRDSIDRLFKCQ